MTERHTARTLWFFGLPGAGKTTAADVARELLRQRELASVALDGDQLRSGLSSDLSFSAEHRMEQARRVYELCRVINSSDVWAVVSLVTPSRQDRARLRDLQKASGEPPFCWVWMSTSAQACQLRDIKGHYARAKAGSLPNFTGIGAVFDPPDTEEVIAIENDGTITELQTQVSAVIDSMLRGPAAR